ncbi:hypothetical protein [Haloplasma contractile]|uniref:Uncharacterized protein n=1 Tax=Haloplasma contractile SSD-17B TaxID=1033810 RepID=U2EEP9_9MOLU|nr:hypothetical protein [Haloplasma contractile]ERJ13176.1 hypothetical protein HLPCO_000795 [Haloplasma contractile SSD-17B]
MIYLMLFKVFVSVPLLKILSLLLFILIGLFVISLFFEVSAKVIKVIIPILGWIIVIGILVITGLWIINWFDLLTITING